VVIVGNGGIALELVYALENIEIIWCSRDRFGRKFLDEGALKFLLESKNPKTNSSVERSQMYTCTEFHRTDRTWLDCSSYTAYLILIYSSSTTVGIFIVL